MVPSCGWNGLGIATAVGGLKGVASGEHGGVAFAHAALGKQVGDGDGGGGGHVGVGVGVDCACTGGVNLIPASRQSTQAPIVQARVGPLEELSCAGKWCQRSGTGSPV